MLLLFYKSKFFRDQDCASIINKYNFPEESLSSHLEKFSFICNEKRNNLKLIDKFRNNLESNISLILPKKERQLKQMMQQNKNSLCVNINPIESNLNHLILIHNDESISQFIREVKIKKLFLNAF